jgi:hypothetical protein
MDREKLIKQLFVGKVAEIIGTEKTTGLLKEATVAIDGMIKAHQADFITSVCDYERHDKELKETGECRSCGKRE